MKHLIFTIIILTCSPSFAACPIDGNGSACIAEFQGTGIPNLANPTVNVQPQIPTTNFSATPPAVNFNRDSGSQTEARNFGATEQNYGYNSSCQFGVCMDTGTPKLFSDEQN